MNRFVLRGILRSSKHEWCKSRHAFFVFALTGVGLLMRKFHFFCMFHNPRQKDNGLSIRIGWELT